jgi:hypothetical protein
LFKAAERDHARLTLSHLLLAVVEDNPVLLDAVLSPKLRATAVQRVLATELGAMPATEGLQSTHIAPDPAVAGAIDAATAATAARYRSDWFFGLELLHAMLTANVRLDRSGRSKALDYVEMALADGSTDAAAKIRESIDRLAYALDEKRPPKTPPASAVTYDPEL